MSQHLLAGTRVTQNRIHLGTYYGMIDQLNRLSSSMRVSFILCDLQSWDILSGKGSEGFNEIQRDTLSDLHAVLSNDIDIILESKIPGIAELGLDIAKNMTTSMTNRISAVKGKISQGESPSFSTVLYPSMMAANMLSVGANCLFNRPETNFQPVNLMNELLRKKMGKEAPHFTTVKKQETKIPNINGTGMMSRTQGDADSIIEVVGVDKKYLRESLERSFQKSTGKSSLVFELWKLEFGNIPFPKDGSSEYVIEQLVEQIYKKLNKEEG